MILLSSLLLIVAGATVVACGVTAVACIQTVAGILAIAGVLLVPDGLLLLVSLVLLTFMVLLARGGPFPWTNVLSSMALPIEFRYSDIPIAVGLSNSYRNIGLTYLSDFNYRTSYIGLPIVR